MDHQHVTLEAFETKLATLSLKDLQTLSAECLDDLEKGKVPASGKPVLDAIARELTARHDMLQQQSAELEQLLAAKQKEAADKHREYLDLKHEYSRMKQLADLRDLQLQEKEATGSCKIGRNDPCPCGSGKKYKHCCGKS